MRFLYQLGFILAPKTYQNRVLEASWGVLGASWRPLGASWARLGASWAHLGTSWRRLGASCVRLGAFWSLLGRRPASRKPFSPAAVVDAFAQLGRREPPIIKEKKDLVQQDYLQKDLRTLQTPVSEPRHAAGRLRARCGSNAQQSCVPATALRS